jgi:hypothetical protein
VDQQKASPNVGLLAVIVVLAAFAAAATTLYLREAGTRADRDRTIATQNAALAARTVELDVVRQRLNTAQAQLDGLQGKRTLDPKVYDAIRKCVLQTVEQQQPNGRANGFFDYQPGQLPAPPTAPSPGPPSDAADPAICAQAATYLN